jgi:hypothetical protein
MKNSARRRPELESLETRQLLSTVMAEAHDAAKVPAVVAASTPLTLSGSGKVTTYFTKAILKATLKTGSSTLTGTAQLQSIGHASVRIVEQVLLPPGVTYEEYISGLYEDSDGSETPPPDTASNMTIEAKRGTILLNATESPMSLNTTEINSHKVSLDFTITGGTGAYAGATGSSIVTLSRGSGSLTSTSATIKLTFA